MKLPNNLAALACLSLFASVPVVMAADSGASADAAPVFEQPPAGMPNFTGKWA